MFLKTTFAVCLAAVFGLASPALAQGAPLVPSEVQDTGTPARQTIGWGRFFNNDYIGDGKDRWRTSSYTISRVRGPEWTGSLPDRLGRVLEFRFRVENVTPETLEAPARVDRRYAGILSLGYHTHWAARSEEYALGVDAVMVGPQTGLSRFQDYIHDGIGLPDGAPSYNAQFGDSTHFSTTGEVGRRMTLAPKLTLRPFVEGQVGFETVARAGADVTIGNLAKDGLMLRDVNTGQRYSAVQGPLGTGLSLTFGGDVARVFSSALLPTGGVVTASDTRGRMRAGLNWQGEKSFVFFGATYLSPEFDQQSEGQTIGSLSLLLRF